MLLPTEIPTPRLVLRPWRDADLAPFAALNADARVMEHFPAPLGRAESDASAARIRNHLEEHGFGLWAVEVIGQTPFIGYTGLSCPRFDAHFTPCVEIGWRLAATHWGHGYATEAARAVLRVAFGPLALPEIVSFTVPANHRSRRVMEKLGMRRDLADDFEHPGLPVGHRLRHHVLYRLDRATWQHNHQHGDDREVPVLLDRREESMVDTYLGATTGVYRLHERAVEPIGLPDERIWAIHAWSDGDGITLLAGSYGHGLYRSADGGRTWERVTAGLTAAAFRCLAPDPLHPGALLAGAEPARLFRSTDGGRSWRELAGITQIAGHERWFLPYSPRAGAVRNVYAPPGSAGRLLASVEVGGLLTSDDSGETWACNPVLDDEDIHFITGHPHHTNRLYAALGYASLTYRGQDGAGRRFGGVARSDDGGQTWRKLETDYTRAVLVPPGQPDLVLAAPAPHVGREGRIVVSADGGDTWAPAGAGIEMPMPDMVEVFVVGPDDSVWAICSGGRLLRASPGEWHWRSALPAAAGITVQSIAFVTPHPSGA